MIKMSVAPCPKPEEKPPEPELEFYLQDDTFTIWLEARNKVTGDSRMGRIVEINKSTGKIMRPGRVNRSFGLPLDKYGRVELHGG